MSEATGKVASSRPRGVGEASRFRGLYILLLAAFVGIFSGSTVTALGSVTRTLHVLLFRLPDDTLLSSQPSLSPAWLALWPAAGGALMGLSLVLVRRWRTRPPVDPIEANAVHGGRMSFRESMIVTAQTLISSSFGASVGLEAGYTQINSSLASSLAARLNLRRNEIRTLVGCGAAGAIAAAFNAPLTGAFYGFEIIIGVYSPSLLAPVIIAALAASLTASRLGEPSAAIDVFHLTALRLSDVLPFLALGFVAGAVAIGIMRLVTLLESGFTRLRCPPPLRPVIGGLCVGGMALVSPEVLSSGHGALHTQLTATMMISSVALVFVLKFAASIVSLGSGFRGGLFFASLLLGALLGKLFAYAVIGLGIAPHLQPELAALVGMGSLAVGVVGGPLTMSFLVLELTGDLGITASVLAASVMSSFLVRETFGYSFSTWRLHLRGETIRGGHDVGRLRSLTVGALMRTDARTALQTMLLETFCAKYPLGSTERVIVVDSDTVYQGIILVAEAHHALAHASAEVPQTIGPLARTADVMLLPSMTAQTAAGLFARSAAEELAVVDRIDRRRVVGLLTEAYLLRRYAEELDKGWRDLTGESG